MLMLRECFMYGVKWRGAKGKKVKEKKKKEEMSDAIKN